MNVPTQISYGFSSAEIIPVSVQEFLQTQSGSYGMGIGFPEELNGREAFKPYGGENANGPSEFRLLNRALLYNRGPFMEGEEFSMIATYVDSGVTSRGNITLGIMGSTVVNGRHMKVGLQPWKYPNGKDRSAHGSDQANKHAILAAVSEGEVIEVTVAKNTGKLLNAISGRNTTASLIIACPQVIRASGKVVYNRDDHPEVLDDRSQGLPEWRQPKQMVRDQRRMWATLTPEQMAMFSGETHEVETQVADLLNEVLS